jgi:hypothetical protein
MKVLNAPGNSWTIHDGVFKLQINQNDSKIQTQQNFKITYLNCKKFVWDILEVYNIQGNKNKLKQTFNATNTQNHSNKWTCLTLILVKFLKFSC